MTETEHQSDDGKNAVPPAAVADSTPGFDAGVPALRRLAPPPPRSAPRKRRWLWAAAGVLALVLGGLAYVRPWVPAVPLVATEVAGLAPVTRVLAVNGRIASAHSVDMRPLVSGRLEQILVEEGDEVAVGQLMAVLDTKAATAALQQATAGLGAARVAEQGARDSFDRANALGGTVARTTLESQARGLQTASQEVARMTALRNQARLTLDNHGLRAPIKGSVLRLTADVGQSVDPSTLILTLADLTDLLVETDVDETYATQIARGQPVVLQLAGETVTRDGQVDQVSGRVDVATGGLAVKLRFDAPVMAPIGLTVTANIIVDQQDAALSLPRTALVTQGAVKGVFVVIDGTARFRPVTVVDWPAARLIVTDGIQVADRLIVDAAAISDGQPVRLDAR